MECVWLMLCIRHANFIKHELWGRISALEICKELRPGNKRLVSMAWNLTIAALVINILFWVVKISDPFHIINRRAILGLIRHGYKRISTRQLKAKCDVMRQVSLERPLCR